MRLYKGPDACPGCGLSGSENPRFGAKELCSDCASFIRIGRDLKSVPNEFTRVFWNSRSNKRLTFTVYSENGERESSTATDPPYYISDFGARNINAPGTSKDLAVAFSSLIDCLNVGERPAGSRLDMMECDRRNAAVIPTPAAKAIYDLFEVLHLYSRQCRLDGFNEGRNLIIGLAKGSITIDNVNDSTTRMNAKT